MAVAEAEGALGDWLCVPGAGCERTGALLAADTAVYGVIRPSAVDAVLLVKQAPAEPLLVPMRWGGAPGMHALVELCREDWFYEDGSTPLLGAAICDVSGDGMRDDIVVLPHPDAQYPYAYRLSLQMPIGGGAGRRFVRGRGTCSGVLQLPRRARRRPLRRLQPRRRR